MDRDWDVKGGCAMRRWVAGLAMLGMLACALMPAVRFTEDRDTVLLARTIYALGRTENYETKLKLGTVVMNRVDSAWFEDDLGEVLRDQQPLAQGTGRTKKQAEQAAALAALQALQASK